MNRRTSLEMSLKSAVPWWLMLAVCLVGSRITLLRETSENKELPRSSWLRWEDLP